MSTEIIFEPDAPRIALRCLEGGAAFKYLRRVMIVIYGAALGGSYYVDIQTGEIIDIDEDELIDPLNLVIRASYKDD